MPNEIEIKTYKTVPDWWDNEIRANSGPYTSLSKWAKTYEDLKIGTGLYIEISLNKKRTALILMYEMILGGTLLLFLPKPILQILRKIPYVNSLSMHIQPAILDESIEEDEDLMLEISEAFVKFIKSYAKSKKINIKPADYVCFKNIESAKKLRDSSEDCLLAGTVRIPLNISVDEKFKSLPRNLLGHINKAKKNNVEIKEVDTAEFYPELYQSWKSYGLAVNPISYYKILKDNSEGFIKYYLAYLNNKPLAGSAIMISGKSILEFSMFTTKYARESKISGGDILKWKLIEDAINGGFKYLDLSMIDVQEEKTEKTENINYFKLKWGGYVYYGITIEQLNVVMSFVRSIKLLILGK